MAATILGAEDRNRDPDGWMKAKQVAQLICWFALAAVLCCLAYFLAGQAPRPDSFQALDLADVLLAAAALAVMLFTAVVGVVAVLQWSALEKQLRAEIATKVTEQVELAKKEMKGRLLASVGHMMGVVAREPGTYDARDRTIMPEVVELCERAHDDLKSCGDLLELSALNNLVFYLALEGNEAKTEYVLTHAKRLRDLGQKRNDSHSLINYCRAILEFSRDKDEIEEARRITRSVLSRESLTPRARKEAEHYMKKLKEVWDSQKTETTEGV